MFPWIAVALATPAFTLTSPAFPERSAIPAAYTCEGEDISPALTWSDVPEGTRSLVLIVDDPDAHVWVHWIVVGIPPAARTLPRGASPTGGLPASIREGRNDWGTIGYRGPCPPIGRHRYVHTLYALDAVLPELDRPTRREVERAMAGHVIGRAELVGMYEKQLRGTE